MGPSGGSALREQLGDKSGRPGVYLKHAQKCGTEVSEGTFLGLLRLSGLLCQHLPSAHHDALSPL